MVLNKQAHGLGKEINMSFFWDRAIASLVWPVTVFTGAMTVIVLWIYAF